MKAPRQLFWLSGSLSFFCLVTVSPAQAQINPDTTLPNPSIVPPNCNACIITGGTQAGSNLFHSFERFSVPSSGTASFQQIDQGIENVLTRVTGGQGSSIDGSIELLQTNGSVSSANFFLLNPNGISFGPNASLNVGGSFLASTASSLNFADGTSFSATNPQTPAPLLKVSAPIGLQFDKPAASIEVQGAFLQVPLGKMLGLVGGDLTLAGGVLVAEGGRIDLGSISGVMSPDPVPVQVSLTPLNSTIKGWALGYEDIQNFGDIHLFQGAAIDASGEGGGDIQVQGGPVTLDESLIGARTQGSRNGGEILVRASQLNVENFSLIGTVTFGSGKGGNVTIETGKLVISGGEISANTFGKGPGGTLAVTASSVEAVGGIVEDGEFFPNGLFTQTTDQTEGAGDAGDLTITTGKLSVREGAQVSSTTFGMGQAGDLTVRQASEVELIGSATSANGEPLTNQIGLPFSSGLFAGTGIGSEGGGGTLTIETERLSLRDGAGVQTTTFGAGNAGNLIIQASELVELTGTVKGSQFPTSLLAVSGGIPGLGGVPEATGRGGNVEITTDQLLIRDGAAVAVSSFNPTSNAEGAGNLTVQAQTIRLDNQGELTAATASGDGGNMTLQVQDLLLLRRNSNISTTAGAGGDGGNITIDTDLLVALEDSNITANASKGQGGNVEINTQGDFRSLDSDITADSDLGIDGLVEINTPDVELQGSLTQPSANFISSDQVVAGSCLARRNVEQGSFVITGTGGLPRSPYEAISGRYAVTSVQPIQATGSSSRATAVESAAWKRGDPIQEAQGMVITADGRTIVGTTPQLVALAKTQKLICHSK